MKCKGEILEVDVGLTRIVQFDELINWACRASDPHLADFQCRALIKRHFSVRDEGGADSRCRAAVGRARVICVHFHPQSMAICERRSCGRRADDVVLRTRCTDGSCRTCRKHGEEPRGYARRCCTRDKSVGIELKRSEENTSEL